MTALPKGSRPPISQRQRRCSTICQNSKDPSRNWRTANMEPIPSALTTIEFGRFSVLPHRRELLAEGRPLELGGRAFDVLMALIEASGAVVSKNKLMERVWPDRIVEEHNLQAQISALRRAFAADRDLIRTIAGRGYQFTGLVRTVSVRLD